MSISILIIMIIVVVLAIIVYPIFIKQEKQLNDFTVDSEWSQEKERVFLQLSDLEYDYRMGKLPEDDYKKIKSDLTETAARYTHSWEMEPKDYSQIVDKEIERYLSEKGLHHEN